MFSFCEMHLPSCKHEAYSSLAFKVLRKIGDEIHSRTFAKNGDQFNENLSWETIFLATTLNFSERTS